MSYKYLYGFTNDPSYDFSKVIYFGKQDRTEPELKRITEHYRDSDPNHEELKYAKYLLVAQVDIGVDLTDLEAYFIQVYRPELNTVYNGDVRNTQKLSEQEIEEIGPLAQKLQWYLVSNDSYAIYILSTIGNINARNKLIGSSVYTFESREEIRTTAFSEIKEKLKDGYGIIRPEIKNSLIPVLLIVTADDYCVEIKEPDCSHYSSSKYFERIQYRDPTQNIFIPELDLGVLDFSKMSREYEYEKMHEADGYKEVASKMFNLWRKMLLTYCEELTEREPGFSEKACINDFPYEKCFFIKPGFNSNNYHLIIHISDMLFSEKLSWEDKVTVHAESLFEGIEDYKKILKMTPKKYVEYYRALPEKILLEIDKAIAEDNLEYLVGRTRELAKNNTLRIIQ